MAMTIGIYSLYWEDQDLVYIGLSTDIERRFRHHIRTLQQGLHDNYKVQEAYHAYGKPSLVVLEECSHNKLGEREIYWINEFDSINKGLNIIEGGHNSYGIRHTTSKYSKIAILRVLILLAKTNLSYQKISTKTKVSRETVAAIANKRVHSWLSMYAEYYELATRNRDLDTKINKSSSMFNNGSKNYHYIITSPEGFIYRTSCVSKFCRETEEFKTKVNAARQGFSKIINGHTNSYFGWTIKKLKNEV